MFLKSQAIVFPLISETKFYASIKQQAQFAFVRVVMNIWVL